MNVYTFGGNFELKISRMDESLSLFWKTPVAFICDCRVVQEDLFAKGLPSWEAVSGLQIG